MGSSIKQKIYIPVFLKKACRFGEEVLYVTITDIYLYSKLCWSRALGHINFTRSIFETIALIIILLKSFDVANNLILLTAIVCIIMVAIGFLVGHWDLKYGIMEKENTLNYKFNKEIQTLLIQTESTKVRKEE